MDVRRASRQNPSLQWLLRHACFWLAVYIFEAYHTYTNGFAEGTDMFIRINGLPYDFLMVYTFLYLILPFLVNGKMAKFGAWATVWAFLLFFSSYIVYNYILLPLNTNRPIPRHIDIMFRQPFSVFIFTRVLSVTLLAATFKLLRYRYKKEWANQQLEREAIVAELQLLKAQVHPHFLLNTMNNLYSLTLEGSDHAPLVVKKLSQLLRYIFYECDAAEVPIPKEMQAIESYIELEKLRYGGRLQIDIQTTGDLYGEKNIAPLLLMPFVENAFKHGASEHTGHAFIDIKLDITDNVLSFKVNNSKKGMQHGTTHGGIGLENVKKRLGLIYPHRHELKITPAHSSFEIALEIYFDNTDI